MKNKIILILALLTPAILYSDRKDDREPSIKHPEVQRPLPFPKHWGHPPRIQVRDHVKLPGKFGFGSSTVAKWISANMKKDGVIPPKERPPKPPVVKPRPPEIQEKVELLKEKQKELTVARRQLLEELKGKSKKDASLLIRDFKEANKQKHLEIKKAQKAVIENIRSQKQTGEKRS